MRVGMDSRVPTVLERPESRAMMDKAQILPRARSRRLRGVMSKVAMVPRSFSPAMDSGAVDMQPENRKIISSIGIMEDRKVPAVSASVARS